MTTYRSVILADSPYVYYRLTEPSTSVKVRDDGTSAHGYDGTYNGTVSAAQSGLIANDPATSVLFGGNNAGTSGGYVALPSGFKTDGWTAFSFECWIEVASTANTDFARIASNDFTQNDNKGWEVILQPSAAGITFNMGNGSAHTSAANNNALAGATVYHIVCTWDGSTMTVYRNAVAASGSAFTGSLGTATNVVSLGYAPAGTTNYLAARLQDVAIYNYALSAAQITTHYNAGLNAGTGPWTIQISRKPYTIQAGTLSCDLAVSRVANASATIKTDTSTLFQQFQPVCIYDQSGALYFSGYIDQPGTTKPGFPNVLLHQLTFRDQHWLADKRVVFDTNTNLAKVYTGHGYDYIIQDIVNNILSAEGVTIGQLYGLAPSTSLAPSTTLAPLGPSVVIPTATFNFPTCAQVFDALAKASSSATITFYWYIDKWKRLFFLPYSAVTGPSVDGTTIDDGRLSHRPPRLSKANPLYYNKQYVPGGTDSSTILPFNFVGDGNVTTWTMPDPVGAAPTIYVNGTSQTVGELNVDTGKAFYWSPGSPTISAASAPASGAVGLIQWNPQLAVTGTYANSTEILNQAALDETSGFVESVVKDASSTSTLAALAEAQANVGRNSQRGIWFQFTTRDTGYAPGQYISVSYAPFFGSGGSSFVPRVFGGTLVLVSATVVQMLVESVHVDDSDGLNYWRTITAVVGPFDATWAAFYRNTLNVLPLAQSINIGV